jgi:SM-20-related protein
MGSPHISTELCALARQQQIVDGLIKDRFSVFPNYFSNELITDLYRELHHHINENHLHAAHIGKGPQRTRAKDIRGDSILWLNGGSAAQRACLNEMEQLRLAFNRQLFLGLTELEAHFACYPPGAGYQKHLDSFQNDNLRRVSIVAYLNPCWRNGDGGELLIYQEERIIAVVPPLGGTLVCFISEDIPHQVAVTRRDRSSIAGWFRVRELDTVPFPCG